MFDDLLNRIRAATPSLLTLTNEETALLEAWLGDHPEPPAYACSEVKRGILCVWEETDPADRDFWTLLRATLKHNQGRTAPTVTPPSAPSPQGALGHGQQQRDEPHPDCLEGGRWLWWKNERHNVPKGVVYRLLAYMWDRDAASFDDLEDARVFESAVAPQTVRSYVNKAKNALPSGFPWQLSADSVARQLTKVSAARGA